MDVLREMVRLAEKRRDEELHMLERVNQYNLGIIAFATGFLTFLFSNGFGQGTTVLDGFLLLVSIFISLFAISPRRLKATLIIEDDVEAISNGVVLDLKEYLLETAALTDKTASNISDLLFWKKKVTILSAATLVSALTVTYILYAMPKIGNITTGI